MSAKITITKEQAEAVENWNSQFYNNGNGSSLLELHAETIYDNSSCCWTEEFNAFTKISLEDMAKIVINGYEVEKPVYQVGDIIARTKDNSEAKVGDLMEVTFVYPDNNGLRASLIKTAECYGYQDSSNIRHATDEEKLWVKHNRKFVGDFRIGDVTVEKNLDLELLIEDEEDIKDSQKELKEGILKGFHPVESFVSFS